jgi:integrase
VTHGKTAAARRMIPLTPRVRAILDNRWQQAGKPDDGWVWPAPTASGRVEPSTLKKQHAKAYKTITEKFEEKPVHPFVLYLLRHTFLTRLVENADVVLLGAERYTIRPTPKRRLRHLDFILDRNNIRGPEQNPQTKSRWAQMARAGEIVMQFLIDGR